MEFSTINSKSKTLNPQDATMMVIYVVRVNPDRVSNFWVEFKYNASKFPESSLSQKKKEDMYR